MAMGRAGRNHKESVHDWMRRQNLFEVSYEPTRSNGQVGESILPKHRYTAHRVRVGITTEFVSLIRDIDKSIEADSRRTKYGRSTLSAYLHPTLQLEPNSKLNT